MAEDTDNPESLTPVQRQYAEIGDAIGKRIVEAGQKTADLISEALEGRGLATRIQGMAKRYSESRGAIPDAAPASPGHPGREQRREGDYGPAPNAGWLHIEPGRSQRDVSLPGRAAIGLSDLQQRAMAYGIQTPPWLNTMTTTAKVASMFLGDTHTYGSRLRERAESATPAGPMYGAPTDQPGAMVSPLSTPAKSIPEIQMEHDGPKTVAQMAGPGLTPGLNQSATMATGDDDKVGEALLQAINRLTEKIDKLIEAQDEGEEDETVQNKKSTLWQDLTGGGEGNDDERTTSRPRAPTLTGGEVTPTRPHQAAAAASLGTGS